MPCTASVSSLPCLLIFRPSTKAPPKISVTSESLKTVTFPLERTFSLIMGSPPSSGILFIMYTLPAILTSCSDASSAELPPPITATSLPSKRGPSHVAQ